MRIKHAGVVHERRELGRDPRPILHITWCRLRFWSSLEQRAAFREAYGTFYVGSYVTEEPFELDVADTASCLECLSMRGPL